MKIRNTVNFIIAFLLLAFIVVSFVMWVGEKPTITFGKSINTGYYTTTPDAPIHIKFPIGNRGFARENNKGYMYPKEVLCVE